MRAENVEFEQLDAAAIRERWPMFVISDDVVGVYQQDAGICAAARGTAAHQRAAQSYGAAFKTNASIDALRETSDGIELVVDGSPYRVAKLVIAAGPWSARALAAFGESIPLEVTKEQVTYFGPIGTGFALGQFPVWIWMDDPSFYGFPIFGEAGVKIAQDAGGKPVDPDTRGFEPDRDISRRMQAFLTSHLPTAMGRELLTKTCLYTLTPDRDFVIDTLPNHPNVSVAIGAGHAFKFASVLGRILSELALDGATASNITGFEIDRPILRMAAPPKTYMV